MRVLGVRLPAWVLGAQVRDQRRDRNVRFRGARRGGVPAQRYLPRQQPGSARRCLYNHAGKNCGSRMSRSATTTVPQCIAGTTACVTRRIRARVRRDRVHGPDVRRRRLRPAQRRQRGAAIRLQKPERTPLVWRHGRRRAAGDRHLLMCAGGALPRSECAPPALRGQRWTWWRCSRRARDENDEKAPRQPGREREGERPSAPFVARTGASATRVFFVVR